MSTWCFASGYSCARDPYRQRQASSDLGAVEGRAVDGAGGAEGIERHPGGSAHRRRPHRLRADPRLADEGDLRLDRAIRRDHPRHGRARPRRGVGEALFPHVPAPRRHRRNRRPAAATAARRAAADHGRHRGHRHRALGHQGKARGPAGVAAAGRREAPDLRPTRPGATTVPGRRTRSTPKNSPAS